MKYLLPSSKKIEEVYFIFHRAALIVSYFKKIKIESSIEISLFKQTLENNWIKTLLINTGLNWLFNHKYNLASLVKIFSMHRTICRNHQILHILQPNLLRESICLSFLLDLFCKKKGFNEFLKKSCIILFSKIL